MSGRRRVLTLEELVGAAPADAPIGASAEPAPAPGLARLTVLVTPADHRRLRQLSLDTGLSVQRLGLQAWSLLLEQRGLPPLEHVAANVPSGRKRT